MLSNALIMLLRIVIMLTVCSLIILFMSMWSRGGELHVSLNKRCSACGGPMEDCSVVDSTVESVESEFWMLFWPIML